MKLRLLACILGALATLVHLTLTPYHDAVPLFFRHLSLGVVGAAGVVLYLTRQDGR